MCIEIEWKPIGIIEQAQTMIEYHNNLYVIIKNKLILLCNIVAVTKDMILEN